MQDLQTLVGELVNCFERLELRYALGGALATSYWGIVRTTQVVDCLVAVPAVDFQRLSDQLNAIGCRQRTNSGEVVDVSIELLRMQATTQGFIECFRDSVVIDLFTSVVPLQEEILRRAVLKPWMDREILVTSAEDLILIKLAFHRAKDLQDVRGIIWMQRDRLDVGYLNYWSERSLDKATQVELEALLREHS
jgi:hypothetical protein